MKAQIFAGIMFFSSVLITGCGSDGKGGGSLDYKDQALQGKIAGGSWTFLAGRSLEDPSNDSVSFKFISNTVDAPCEDFIWTADDGNSVMMSFETAEVKEAEYKLSFDLSNSSEARIVTIYDGETNILASEGKIKFTSLTPTTIEGAIVANYEADNTVNGNFTATRCCKLEVGVGYEPCSE